MPTLELTKNNFESTINRNETVFVDFWASWCGPCRMFAPIYEEASDQHHDIVFGKVDTEAESELAQAFGIRSIPTLMVFRDNIVLYAQPGAVPANAFDDLIGQVKALDMDEVRRKIGEREAEHHHDGDS